MNSDNNIRKLTQISVTVLCVNVLFAFMIIMDSVVLKSNFLDLSKISSIYRTYILPGPFFPSNRIIDNYSLYVAWKENDRWTFPVCAPCHNFNEYQSTFNMTSLYRSRLEQTLSFNVILSQNQNKVPITRKQEWSKLKQYLFDKVIPQNADSVQVFVITTKAKNFSLKTDTLNVYLGPRYD
jgi:hypothetical protein